MTRSRGGGLVACLPIAEAVQAVIDSGRYTWSEVAVNAGLVNERNGEVKADTTRLKRRLGLAPESGSRKRFQTHLTYSLAVQIVRGAGLDPVDVDL